MRTCFSAFVFFWIFIHTTVAHAITFQINGHNYDQADYRLGFITDLLQTFTNPQSPSINVTITPTYGGNPITVTVSLTDLYITAINDVVLTVDEQDYTNTDPTISLGSMENAVLAANNFANLPQNSAARKAIVKMLAYLVSEAARVARVALLNDNALNHHDSHQWSLLRAWFKKWMQTSRFVNRLPTPPPQVPNRDGIYVGIPDSYFRRYLGDIGVLPCLYLP